MLYVVAEGEGRGFRGRMAETELGGTQTLSNTSSAGLFCLVILSR